MSTKNGFKIEVNSQLGTDESQSVFSVLHESSSELDPHLMLRTKFGLGNPLYSSSEDKFSTKYHHVFFRVFDVTALNGSFYKINRVFFDPNWTSDELLFEQPYKRIDFSCSGDIYQQRLLIHSIDLISPNPLEDISTLSNVLVNFGLCLNYETPSMKGCSLMVEGKCFLCQPLFVWDNFNCTQIVNTETEQQQFNTFMDEYAIQPRNTVTYNTDYLDFVSASTHGFLVDKNNTNIISLYNIFSNPFLSAFGSLLFQPADPDLSLWNFLNVLITFKMDESYLSDEFNFPFDFNANIYAIFYDSDGLARYLSKPLTVLKSTFPDIILSASNT
jgi:hypothetical protein